MAVSADTTASLNSWATLREVYSRHFGLHRQRNPTRGLPYQSKQNGAHLGNVAVQPGYTCMFQVAEWATFTDQPVNLPSATLKTASSSRQTYSTLVMSG